MVTASAYRIDFVKEGTNTTQPIVATYITKAGGRLTLQMEFNANFNEFYYFKVFALIGNNYIEIYRGKAFATDEADPMRYSIYKPFNSMNVSFDSNIYFFDSTILTFDQT